MTNQTYLLHFITYIYIYIYIYIYYSTYNFILIELIFSVIVINYLIIKH